MSKGQHCGQAVVLLRGRDEVMSAPKQTALTFRELVSIEVVFE